MQLSLAFHENFTPRLPSLAASDPWGPPGSAECPWEHLASLPEVVWTETWGGRFLSAMRTGHTCQWSCPVTPPQPRCVSLWLHSSRHTVMLGVLPWCGSPVLEVDSSP